MLPDFLDNLRIGIVGFGVNNRALTRWLVGHGASEVVVYDENPNARNHGTTLDVEWVVGKEAFNNIQADIIFKTPGVPFDSPGIVDAIRRGVIVSSQTELLLTLCPCKTIGVTGTKGKGTTSTLINKIMENHFEGTGNKVYLAGNIGKDPFEFLDELKSEDLVVLELSSFQLERIKKSPNIALVLGVTSDHLDYHHTQDAYREAKTGIVRNQSPEDIAIFNLDDETSLSYAELAVAKSYYYSISKSVDQGVFLKDGAFYWRENPDESSEVVAYADDTQLPGAHNFFNIAAALATCLVAGAKISSIIPVLRQYKGLPHRLEKIAEKRGIVWYDDSASTNPSTTIAAIQAFMEPKILIVGGSEKGADFLELGKAIAENNVKKLIIMGSTGPKIALSAETVGFDNRNIIEVQNMEDAVSEANNTVEPGNIVLLSPASASFDMFANYEVRGDHFQLLAKTLMKDHGA